MAEEQEQEGFKMCSSTVVTHSLTQWPPKRNEPRRDEAHRAISGLTISGVREKNNSWRCGGWLELVLGR